MSKMTERLKVAVFRLKGRKNSLRDIALLALACSFPSMKVSALASMTVGEARRCLQGRSDFPARLTLGALDKLNLPDEALVFSSRKGRGTKPAHRVTIWRVLHQALGGGFRLLRKLMSKMLPRPIQKKPVKLQRKYREIKDFPARVTVKDLMDLFSQMEVPSG